MKQSKSACCTGLDPLSHKKKATFWRQLAEAFPELIDFLCNPNDLGQVLGLVRPPWRLVGLSLPCALQDALRTGLDGFYRSYIASESDTRDLEVEDAMITTSLYSCIRLEFRGSVCPSLLFRSRHPHLLEMCSFPVVFDFVSMGPESRKPC